MSRTHLGKRHLSSLGLFLAVLALSMVILGYTNAHTHDQLKENAYVTCVADRQIAANQRRVLLALIDLEAREEEHIEHDGVALRRALRSVPKFDCRR